MKRFGVLLSLGLTLALLMPALRAQSCFGNGGVTGLYAFVGSRSVFAGVPVTAPGTSGAANTGSTGSNSSTGTGTTTTPIVSNTPVGQLIGGVAGSAPFALVGMIGADGAGNLVATPSATGTSAQVGTYAVNSDCTISVTLNDVFVGLPVTAPGTSGATSTGSPSTGKSATPATPVTVKLEGLVLDGGAEIDLVQTGTADTGAVITLRRALLSFGTCTDQNVVGPFALIARASTTASSSGTSGTNTGTTSGTNSSLAATSFLGRFVANGTGEFVADALGVQSPLQNLQLTGTYAVNPDCSGTATFVDSATGVTHNADFVIIQGQVYRSAASNAPLPATSPELIFSFTDDGVSGFGVAKQQ